MDKAKLESYNCAVEAAMDIVGGKYKAIIIYELIDKTLRYNEIQKCIPQATPKMLSHQLKELKNDGIINRVLYPVVPPKTEYSLTELGKTFVPIVKSLCKWGEDYFQLNDVPIPCNKSK
ncbi:MULTISPECIES: helix-turn-helix domain-containing protein [Clostridium]|uniref:Putative HTH-type transcriptional regulator YybR n=1 Tax=Clostridium ragsdalei P11 TaxID=1353534 RepID=A0A1A6AW90_9CLOT|nr:MULTISPECIES: helix-turn-helix domain-containing protein [Clostridium]OBR94351.1 putative HTH-type transcriptional regulator YybR [Clostridium ragsdalei P11]QXE18397.1 transcriptional regulator [Clostridium sp. 001]